MKTPEPITWTCDKTGVVVKFQFRENSGWSASFPNGSLQQLRTLKENGVELPWPEVPEEYKKEWEEFDKGLALLTGRQIQ